MWRCCRPRKISHAKLLLLALCASAPGDITSAMRWFVYNFSFLWKGNNRKGGIFKYTYFFEFLPLKKRMTPLILVKIISNVFFYYTFNHITSFFHRIENSVMYFSEKWGLIGRNLESADAALFVIVLFYLLCLLWRAQRCCQTAPWMPRKKHRLECKRYVWNDCIYVCLL